MNTSFYKKTIITSLILIALIVSAIVFLLVPSINKLKDNKSKINSKQTEFETAADHLNALQKMDKNKDNIETEVTVIENYLPDTINSSSFIVEIEGLAKALGIVIDSFAMPEMNSTNTKKDAKKDSLAQNDFSLTAKSSYANAFEFVKQLEALSRFNTISSINISSTQGDEVSLKLTGQIYYANK